MASPFIPLLLGNPNAASVPAANQVQGQAPAGNSFIPALALPAAPLAAAQKCGGPHPPAVACSEPLVTLQRDGEHVTHIRLQCACGQVVELACTY